MMADAKEAADGFEMGSIAAKVHMPQHATR